MHSSFTPSLSRVCVRSTPPSLSLTHTLFRLVQLPRALIISLSFTELQTCTCMHIHTHSPAPAPPQLVLNLNRTKDTCTCSCAYEPMFMLMLQNHHLRLLFRSWVQWSHRYSLCTFPRPRPSLHPH